MKRELKGFVVGVIVTVLLTSTALAEPVTKTIQVVFNKIKLEVNGTKVNADNILYEGTTYVPLRKVAEMLGKHVGWNAETNTAIISDTPITQSNKEDNKDVAIVFGDEDFEKYIRLLIDKPKGPIMKSDVKHIKSIDLSSIKVSSLKGIEHFTNLRMLNLGKNIVLKNKIQ